MSCCLSQKVPDLAPMRFSYNCNLHLQYRHPLEYFPLASSWLQQSTMEVKTNWGTGKAFQVIVTQDCPADDNFLTGFRVIPSSAHSPRTLRPKEDSFPPILLKISLCLGLHLGGGEGVEDSLSLERSEHFLPQQHTMKQRENGCVLMSHGEFGQQAEVLIMFLMTCFFSFYFTGQILPRGLGQKAGVVYFASRQGLKHVSQNPPARLMLEGRQ